jgi:hypothetical protein
LTSLQDDLAKEKAAFTEQQAPEKKEQEEKTGS